jgi:hypothetical protein
MMVMITAVTESLNASTPGAHLDPSDRPLLDVRGHDYRPRQRPVNCGRCYDAVTVELVVMNWAVPIFTISGSG